MRLTSTHAAAIALVAITAGCSSRSEDEGVVTAGDPLSIEIVLSNPFFEPLGANGRACANCHQADQGWTITPRYVQAKFDASDGTERRRVDARGATRGVQVDPVARGRPHRHRYA